MTKQSFSKVQRHLDQVYVACQNDDIPQPGPDEVVLKMVACGVCGADIRVVTKNKAASGDASRCITLGHEGAGSIVALGENVSTWQPGDYAVVLPHVHRREQEFSCSASRITPVCIGSGHTLHMGWSINGCFTDYMVVPATHVVRVAQRHLRLATKQAPTLNTAVFALVEPMLCTLSAYELIKTYLQHNLPSGRVLVIGCGPIGILHSLVLLARGFEVWLMDTVQGRVKLAQWCLDQRTHICDPMKQNKAFDMVMVTASSAAAIRAGEKLVRKGGMVYLFAGLNTADLAAMDHEGLFLYESLHRKALSLQTIRRHAGEEKSILYLGHSGYYEALAPQAIAMVASNAAALDRTVTGIIPGFTSTRILSRLPGGVDWTPGDQSPAIVSVLQGADLRERHCKLLVLPDAENRS